MHARVPPCSCPHGDATPSPCVRVSPSRFRGEKGQTSCSRHRRGGNLPLHARLGLAGHGGDQSSPGATMSPHQDGTAPAKPTARAQPERRTAASPPGHAAAANSVTFNCSSQVPFLSGFLTCWKS